MFRKLFLAIALLFSVGANGAIQLTPANTVTLKGPVMGPMISNAIKSLADSKEETTYLVIDSPGGSIIAGLELAKYLQNTDKNIVCVAKTAISMAFVILQACNERVVMNDSVLMQHVASYSLEGDEPNNYSRAKFIRSIVTEMEATQAARIGLSLKSFKSKTRDDWWLYGQEAVDANAADEQDVVLCDESMVSDTYMIKVPVMFFVVDLKFSKCPLVSAPLSVAISAGLSNASPSVQAKVRRYLDLFDSTVYVEGIRNGRIKARSINSFK